MDLVMQVATQPHTHRVWRYFHDRQQWQDVFPVNFADDAEEVGPFTATEGPCLVLFKNMHLTPEQLDAWLLACFVGRVCMRVFWLDRSIPAAGSWDELVQTVAAAPTPPDIAAVRVDVYPKNTQLEIGYSHVLYAVQLTPTCIRWSYMPAQQAWKMPSTAPARFDKSVATAINKLAEAMQVLGLRHAPNRQQHQHQQALVHSQQQAASAAAAAAAAAPEAAAVGAQQQQEPQQQSVRWAIDLGACPGGWTSYLADSCCYNVLAVDPAPLHPDVTARPRVQQILGRAQDVGEQVDAALAGQQADLLVCDMNDHPVRVGELLLPLLPKLKPGGWLILTLKFYGRGREKATMVHHLDKYFQSEMEGGRLTWLLANTLCERTYLAQRRLQA
ncbi:hypothetical protein COO60DRAFT_1668602 [Scenedesmus sp. NREL 46B-D3]|nr:hypothetical protein COO60DRAFT_1668602 [Scenedesmus sp. NREL 46B-D3]